jgi:DNA-binding transcriptional LysR family regulator
MHNIRYTYVMDLEHLRLFAAISRSRSLTEGARTLGLSQSAASQAVAQLEADLGTPLLDRSCRPIALTPPGARFHAGVEELLGSWDRLVAGLRPSATSGLHGTVTVAAIASLGLHLLTGLVQRFAVRCPAVRIRTQHLRHDMVVPAVRERRVDLGILSYPVNQRGIEIIHLRDERLVVVCHPAHRLAARRRIVLADLTGQRLVAFDRDQPIRRAVDAALRRAGVRVDLAMELDNVESIKQAVQSRCGLAIVPEPTVLRETASHLLTALAIEDVPLFRPVAAVRRRAPPQPAAEEFLSFLRESIAHQSPDAISAPVAPLRHARTPSPWE